MQDSQVKSGLQVMSAGARCSCSLNVVVRCPPSYENRKWWSN